MKARFVERDAGVAKINSHQTARIISDVRKLLAAGVSVPAAGPDDVAYAKRRTGLTDEERELLARGLTLVRAQAREGNPRKL
jgi:hypothetical protein